MLPAIRIASVLPLLPQLGLSDRLRYAGVAAAGVALTEHTSTITEELLRRHHHLLVVSSAARRLTLVDQIEQVGLVLSILHVGTARCAYSVCVAHRRAGSLVSVLPVVDRGVVVVMLCRAEARVLVVASVALPELDHEVADIQRFQDVDDN